jgi:hypothetical protein
MSSSNNIFSNHREVFGPASDEGGAGGGGAGWNNQLSRRSFLKRTGGATAATFVAWHISSSNVRADSTQEVAGDSSKTNSVIEFEVTKAMSFQVLSQAGFLKKFEAAKKSGDIKDVNWSVPIPNPVEKDGTVQTSPPGASLGFGNGSFTLPVGKYKVTVYKTKKP